MRKAEELGIEVEEPEEFEAVTGKGVRAKVRGKEVLAGNRRLMVENGIDLESVEETLQRLESEGKTAIVVAMDGRSWESLP